MGSSKRTSETQEDRSNPLAVRAEEFRRLHKSGKSLNGGVKDRQVAIIRMYEATQKFSKLFIPEEELTPVQVNLIYGSVFPHYQQGLFPEALRLLSDEDSTTKEIEYYLYAMEKAYGILQPLSTKLGQENEKKSLPLELEKKDFDEFLTAIVQLDGQASQYPSSRKAVGAFLIIAGAIAIAVALGPAVLAAVPHVLGAGATVLGASATAKVSAVLGSAAAAITHSAVGSYLIGIGSYLSSLGTTYIGAKAVYAAGVLGKLLAQSPLLSLAGGMLGVKLGGYIRDTEAKPVIKFLTDIYKKTQSMAEDIKPDIKADVPEHPGASREKKSKGK